MLLLLISSILATPFELPSEGAGQVATADETSIGRRDWGLPPPGYFSYICGCWVPAKTARSTVACNYQCLYSDPWGVNRASNTYAQTCDCELDNINGIRKSDGMYNSACDCTGEYAKFMNGFPSDKQGDWNYYKSQCDRVYYPLAKPSSTERCRNYPTITESKCTTGTVKCSGTELLTCKAGKFVAKSCSSGQTCTWFGKEYKIQGTNSTLTTAKCNTGCIC
jgi:hypothetical protein